jgi:hypothetical protein
MPPTDPSPEKRALLEAYEAAVQRGPAPPPRRRRSGAIRPFTIFCLAVLLGLVSWLYVGRPVWLFARGMPAQSAEMREASLRLAMSLQYERIEQFRDSTGRLPLTLAETGPPLGQLTYTKTQFGEFMLEGNDSLIHLTLRSGDSLAAFVGNAYDVVSHRGQP